MKVRRAHAALLAALVLAATACGRDDTAAARPASQAEAPTVWPPRVGEPYPDVHLVEMVGMTCPACQGFSGAKRLGTFGGVESDGGLPAIDELVPQYARGVTFPSDDLVFVQILLFDMTLGAPTEDDARAWAQHFDRDVKKHQYVLAGGPALHNDASFVMVPGFQLIDRRFVLRWDATGHSPRHNLYTQLLPAIPALLKDG
jgi:hypothetical protein